MTRFRLFDHAGETAPRVRVHTLDGSYLQLAHVEADEVADIVELLQDVSDESGTDILSFDLDDGRSQVHIPRAAVARVDIDWEVGLFGRLANRLAAWWDALW